MASLCAVSLQTPAILPLVSSLCSHVQTRSWISLGYASNFPKLKLRTVIAMSNPTDIGEKLSESIREAEEVCAAENNSGECAAAWDEVEELSAEIARKREQQKAQSLKKDPLEEYCKNSPEADECRVYED